MTLDEVRPGGRVRIRRNGAPGSVGQRLMDMGFHRGVELQVVRNAPLVDPVEFLMDGQHVSLRHEEARFVEVEAL
ncbi:FeoA family protein [Aminiphilus sp.]|jgi:ferrous iron transport protein A|uniref:FeoA family protein n=1 Tax=Aminiphilus sp. TaxID=1872488 RepID=UPI001BCB88D9|nr:FeoA family protein [Aminiphilus sp.]